MIRECLETFYTSSRTTPFFRSSKINWQQIKHQCVSSPSFLKNTAPSTQSTGKKAVVFLTCKIFFFLSPIPVGLQANLSQNFPNRNPNQKKKWFLSTAFKYSLQTIHILTSFYAYLKELLLLSQLLQMTSKIFMRKK